MISREDFASFRNHPAFQEQSAAGLQVIEALAAELVNRSRPDGDRDQYVRGFIKGMVSVLEWEPEFIDRLVENPQEEEDEAVFEVITEE